MQIVHIASPGQLCNKLFSTAILYAHARSQGKCLLSCVLGTHRAPFVLDARDIEFRDIHPTRKRIAEAVCQRMPSFSVRLNGYVGWHMLNSRLSEDLAAPSPGLRKVLNCRQARLLGYRYRDWDATWSAREHLRKQFSLKNEILVHLDDYWRSVRPPSGRVLGLHVRRGDYREWHGGEFFLEWSEYAAIASRTLAELGNIERIVVTSNEPIPEAAFEGLPIRIGPGNAVLDLYALSRCDYVVGPPSTYSLWAAFMGDVMIKHIGRDTATSTEFAFLPMSMDVLAQSAVL